MSNRILVKEGGVVDFFKSFFKAKSQGKESEWLQKLRKADPKLADVWKKYDDQLSRDIQNQKQMMQKIGADTSYLDDFIKKYGLKN